MPSLRDDSGLTLTELLVVSVLIGVILAASFVMFQAAGTMNDAAMARSNASDEAQAAIDVMTRDLRQAQEDSTDKNGVFRTANATEMKFSADTNNDARPELIRYYVEGGALKRTVAPPTNVAPPFTYGAAGTPKVLVRVLGTSADPLFCYHGVAVNTAAVCGTAKHGFVVISTTSPYTTSPKISMVGITLSGIGTSGTKQTAVTSRVLVRMRTTENLLE
jgi:prepilin-type N-terminal cleavage/methylation domain-containing protein